ncbi:MAG: hypothetical protein C4538_00485 [Nitrospiraceae bacterium]|nr:MAG: hypothetical protein C4538_00485 [Nitrospiraceae bacterium]
MKAAVELLLSVLILILIISGAPSLAQAANQSRTSCSDNPSLMQMTPTSLNTGQTIQLSLVGLDLEKASVSLDLGAGIIVMGKPVAKPSIAATKMYTVSVNVLPSAPAGAHPVKIKFCNGTQTKETGLSVTVIAAAPIMSDDRIITDDRTGETNRQQCTENPRIDQMNPYTAVQGQMNLQLELRGWDLDKPGMMFDFGAGIVVIGRPLMQKRVSDRVNIYKVGINVLPAAPSGAHALTIRYCNGTKTLQTRATLLVNASTQQTPVAVPQIQTSPAVSQQAAPPTIPTAILAVAPNQWQPGKSYHLIITGMNLVSGMEVQFGSGIKNKSTFTVLSTNLAKLLIEVEPSAKGSKKARMRMASSDPWKDTSAVAFIQTVEAAQAPVKKAAIKLPDFKPELAIKGKIFLDEPKWREMIGSTVPPKGPDGKPLGQPTPIYQQKHPVLNDSLIFDWHEQNPGTAEWFEIRFFRQGQLIATRKIESKKSWYGLPFPPSSFRPDGPLVGELLKAVPAKSGSKDTLQLANMNGIQGSVDLETALPKADLAWEVAGFRKYSGNGVVTTASLEEPVLYAASGQQGSVMTDAPAANLPASQAPVIKEVEISERWPLYAADRPTGLACPTASSTGGLDVVNIDAEAMKNKGGVKISTANHAYDRFALSGKINLAKSPYAAHASKTQTSTPDTSGSFSGPLGGSVSYGSKSQVLFTTWTFENVFIDWGDGTVQPLSMTQGGDAGDYSQEKALDISKAMEKYQHAYKEPGSYTVRIYQLSSDDVQGGGQQAAVSSISNNQAGGSLYQLAMGASGGVQAKASAAEMEYGKAVADRAYMLFCKNIIIEPRTDPDANGLLHLVNIEVQGFPNPPGNKKTMPKKTKANTSAEPATTGSASNSVSAVNAAIAVEELSPLSLLGNMPAYSACDYQLTAGAKLSYYGQGDVKLTWFVDSMALPSEEFPVGPSKGRPDKVLSQPQSTWGDPVVDDLAPLLSPPIGLEKLGKREVRVEAEVVHKISGYGLMNLVQAALGAGGKQDAGLAQALSTAMKQEGVKLGVLSPFKTPVKGGTGPMSFLNTPLERVAAAGLTHLAAKFSEGNSYAPLSDVKTGVVAITKKQPPEFVQSETRQYLVVGYNSEQPCTLKFPVKDGYFLVAGLQEPGGKSKVTRKGNSFSGQGELIVPVPTVSGVKTLKAPITFQDWKVVSDGVSVDSGTFDITNSGLPETLLSGLKGRFSRLKGAAGDHVDAWLDAQLSNTALTKSASPGAVPEWKGVMAALSPAGDWFAAGTPMPEILIYDTGFRITPASANLDLSAKEGAQVSSNCQGDAGIAWRGVQFGSGTVLNFYNFDLPVAPPQTQVSDWAIDSAGICGKANTGQASHQWLKGKISWSNIAAQAQGGSFKATYHDLIVHVPWLNVDLKGSADPVITGGKGQGTGGITLALTGGPKTVKNGPVTLKADNMLFTTLKGIGPVVQTDTCFDFQGEKQAFAKDVCVNGLHYGLDGKAYFADGKPHAVQLTGKKGNIAQSTVDLKSVVITASAGSENRLGFAFDTDLTISKVLQAAKAPVSYSITESPSGVYNGTGPVTGSVTAIQFVSPNIKATITPVYAGPTDGSAGLNPVQFAMDNSSGMSDAPFQIALATPSNIIYKGSVDLTPFELGVPVKGVFVLGYQGDTDFWAAKGTFVFPASGAPLVPPLVNMFEVGGGLGYHVTRASLIDANLEYVQFSSDSVPVFNAHTLIGSGWDGGFTFAVKGELTIKTGGSDSGVGMNYDAWLLSSSHGGKGDLYGDLTYGGGAFSGNMNGHLSIFGTDAVYVEAKNNAIAFSVGNGDWYFNLGSEGNPVTGHVLVVDAGAWMNLSKSKGLHVGAKADKRFPDITCDSGTCAYVQGKVKVDAGINPSPFSLSAKGNAGVDAKACASGFCLGAGVDASVHAGVPPPSLGFACNLNGCPIGKLSVGLDILPAPKPNISASFCSLAEAGEAIATGIENLGSALEDFGESVGDAITSCLGLC